MCSQSFFGLQLLRLSNLPIKEYLLFDLTHLCIPVFQTSDVFDDTNDWITTSTPTADCTENTFMQVTMDDLDLAEVTNNSFCQPKANEDKTSTDVYYTNSYRDQKSQTCTRKPFTRYNENV